MKVTIIGGGGRVGSNAAFALQCAGVIAEIQIIDANADMAAGEGPIVDVRVDCGGEALLARLTRYSVERLGLAPGTPVHALVKSVALDRRSLSGPRSPAAGPDADFREG